MNRLNLKKNAIIGLLVLSIAIISIIYIKEQKIENVICKTYDGYIEVDWDSSLNYKKTIIDVYDNQGYMQTYEVDAGLSNFLYSEGTHGNLYYFDVRSEGQTSSTAINKAMFLNYSEMPNIDLIEINTEYGVSPTCELIEPTEEENFGTSIINNDYVNGSMEILREDSSIIKENMKIKVRGNSSSVLSYNKQYKIVLSNPTNLFYEDENIQADTEYLLLNKGTSIDWLVGLYVSSYLGVEWQPKIKYVNVIMNGDYIGCYLLVENIKRGTEGINVDDSGYIFENDLFYWNTNGEYVKTTFQKSSMGWTFKYPDKFDYNSAVKLQEYINEFEEYLFNNDERYSEYIDIDSFSSWLLVNDILSMYDELGTNMYCIKYDYDDSNPTSSKIKMLTNWDFDGIYGAENDDWSPIHKSNTLYFQQLLQQRDFQESYLNNFNKIKYTLVNDASDYLYTFLNQYGDDVQTSWELTNTRYEKSGFILSSEIPYFISELQNKIEWIDNNISGICSN